MVVDTLTSDLTHSDKVRIQSSGQKHLKRLSKTDLRLPVPVTAVLRLRHQRQNKQVKKKKKHIAAATRKTLNGSSSQKAQLSLQEFVLSATTGGKQTSADDKLRISECTNTEQ